MVFSPLPQVTSVDVNVGQSGSGSICSQARSSKPSGVPSPRKRTTFLPMSKSAMWSLPSPSKKTNVSASSPSNMKSFPRLQPDDHRLRKPRFGVYFATLKFRQQRQGGTRLDTPPCPFIRNALATVVVKVFHRVWRVFKGVDLFPFQLHVAFDLILGEHVAF